VRGIVATEGWSEAGMEAGRKNGHAGIRLTILRVDKQQAAHEWGARQSLSFRGGCGIRIGSDCFHEDFSFLEDVFVGAHTF
jgi:hypothetical protein